MKYVLTVSIAYESDELFNEELDAAMGIKSFGHLQDAFEGNSTASIERVRLTDVSSARSHVVLN